MSNALSAAAAIIDYRVVPAGTTDVYAAGADANHHVSEAEAEETIASLRALGGEFDHEWEVIEEVIGYRVTPASFAEAEQLNVEEDPETDGGLVAPARDRAHAVEVEQRAEASGLRASSAKDSDGAWWIYVAPVA